MAEGLAALSLVCNILQVAEFAHGILSKGREIYKAGHGAEPTNYVLEKCSKQLVQKNAALKQAIQESAKLKDPDTEDIALTDLAQECNKEAINLIGKLSSLRVHGSGSRIDSIRSALKAVMKKDEINEMAERMKAYQDQINAHLIQNIK